MPRVIKTSANVKAARRNLSQWATCVKLSSRVNADLRDLSERATCVAPSAKVNADFGSEKLDVKREKTVSVKLFIVFLCNLVELFISWSSAQSLGMTIDNDCCCSE